MHLILQVPTRPHCIAQATIVPRGHALGMVSQVPEKDEYSVTRQQMLAQIDVCMGGKAAEELIFGGWNSASLLIIAVLQTSALVQGVAMAMPLHSALTQQFP